MKEVASLNMLFMPVTPETSQEFRGWLKEVAASNILLMPVTPETSRS